MAVAFAAGFGWLSWRQQSNFGIFGFDLGIHDQAIWLASTGHRMFDTVRGLDYFGENVNLISLAFVPLYWLGAGPHLLVLFNAAVLAAGALPLWLITRDRIVNRWAALVVPGAYLLYPSLGYLAWWGFHPDSFTVTPLLFAWWFAMRRRWVPFAACVLLALAAKEDAALAVLGMGLAIAWWRHFEAAPGTSVARRPAHSRRPTYSSRRAYRRAGLVAAAGAVVWFELCTKVIIPGNNGGAAPFYSSYFPAFGTTPLEVAYNAVRHPSRSWHVAQLATRRTYYFQMLAPVGFLALLALPALLVGLPQLLVNVADQAEGLSFTSQYGTLVMVGVFVATAEALGVVRRRLPALVGPALALLAATTLASTLAWGITPAGSRFHTWWRASDPVAAQLGHALSLVPVRAGVSVTYDLTTHVTHRVDAFEFPNPWIDVNWLSKTVPERPAAVSWIVVDGAVLDDTSRVLLDHLTSPGGGFHVVYQRSGVEVATRDLLSGPSGHSGRPVVQ